MKKCKKVFIRFIDGHELKLAGDVGYKINYERRVVTVTESGFQSFFNFDQMQFIQSIIGKEDK